MGDNKIVIHTETYITNSSTK